MKKLLAKKKKEPAVILPPSLDSFPDFTKKEIFTQGQLIDDLLGRYIKADKINFDFLKVKIDKIKRIYIIGGGTDYSCAVFGAYNFEVLLDIISVPLALGEFMYSNPILDKNTLVVLIGESSSIQRRIEGSGARLIRIMDFSDSKSDIVLNYKTLGRIPTASYSLKLTALAMLALYFGEKNQVITSLYVKIATQMLRGLKNKIKAILSREYIVNEIAGELDSDKLLFTGTNVDYAVAIYAGELLQSAECFSSSISLGQLNSKYRDNFSIIALASNIDFYNLISNIDDFKLKIVSSSVDAADDKMLSYDESIPLLNPILSGVIIQMIAYTKQNG
ncbi:MAG: SIS domain-containing protein [Eubacterium sp.]|nr:SIS domain-containing protein [Eubacterium sp.]